MSAPIEPEAFDSITPQEVEPLAHRLAAAYWKALKAEAEGRINGIRHAMRDKQQLLDASPDNLEWHDLSYVEQLEPGSGFEVYNHIKQVARDELESGQRAADIVANPMMRPWVKARYLALRQSFIADWKPTGSIETRLIEMMAHLYCEYEHWMELSIQRVAVACQQERFHIEVRGKWRAVGLNGDQDAQQAAEMVDRYNRLFLRTLRQLRDLRRYNVPVIINNAEQVNLATDGGQQVNVQQKKRGKKSAKKEADSTNKREQSRKAVKPKPKQLAKKSPEEVIEMNSSKDKRQGRAVAPGSRRLKWRVRAR
jgi:hypothetical protein